MDFDVIFGVEVEIIDGFVDVVNDDVLRIIVEIELVVSCFVFFVVVVVLFDVGWLVVEDLVVVVFVVDE